MRNVLLMALTFCLLLTGTALADTKIGVVNAQVIFTQSEPAKDAAQKINNKYGAERSQLDNQYKALQKKAEGLKGNNVSEEKRLEIVRMNRDLNEKALAHNRKRAQDEEKLYQDLWTLVARASREVAQRKGINFVVEATAGGVLHAEPSMDLTQEVLAEVNKLWKSGALNQPQGKKKK